MFVLCKCTTLQFFEDIYIKNKTLKKHKAQNDTKNQSFKSVLLR